ncbi:MAG: hypothetical protein PUP91_19510 [Rhizonema sp. PD37]|nr:hypothetical protein [Rhizonema sp. PD37]
MMLFDLTNAVWINTFAIALSMPLPMPVQVQLKIGFGTNHITGTSYGTAKTYSATTYGTAKTYHPGINSTAINYGGTAYSKTKTYITGTNGIATTYGGTAYETYNTGTEGTVTTNSIGMMNETHANVTSKNYGMTTYGTSKNYGKTTYQGTIYGISKTYKTLKTNSLNIKNSNGKNSGRMKNAIQKKNDTHKNYGGIVLSNNATRASLIKEAKNYQKTNAPTEGDRFDWNWLNWGGLFSLSVGIIALFSYRLLSDRSKPQRRALTGRSSCRSYTFMLSPKLSPAYQNRLRGNNSKLQRDRAFNQPSRSRSYTVKLSPQLSAASQKSTSE